MSCIQELHEMQKDKAFQQMMCEAELKREIELKDREIEELERDWLESQSKKYTKILSEYGLTFNELDDEEKYQLIAHEATCEEIAINRGVIEEYTFEIYNNYEEKLCEVMEKLDFSKTA